MVLGGKVVAAVKAQEPDKPCFDARSEISESDNKPITDEGSETEELDDKPFSDEGSEVKEHDDKPLSDEGSEKKELDPDCTCICFCDQEFGGGHDTSVDEEPDSDVLTSPKEVTDDSVSDGNRFSENYADESERNTDEKTCEEKDDDFREPEERGDRKQYDNEEEDQKDFTEEETDDSDEDKDEALEDDDEEEEELVDPQQALREQCGEKKECASLKERLDECNARVESRSKTAETCVEELLDFMHCVDHCASKSLFSKLK